MPGRAYLEELYPFSFLIFFILFLFRFLCLVHFPFFTFFLVSFLPLFLSWAKGSELLRRLPRFINNLVFIHFWSSWKNTWPSTSFSLQRVRRWWNQFYHHDFWDLCFPSSLFPSSRISLPRYIVTRNRFSSGHPKESRKFYIRHSNDKSKISIYNTQRK